MKRQLPTLRSVANRPSNTKGAGMTHEEALIFGAELGSCPEVDLHDDPPDFALAHLEGFMKGELRQKTEVVRIIHGRGSGVLARRVLEWLKRHRTIVSYYRPSERMHEAGAVTYACLVSSKR